MNDLYEERFNSLPEIVKLFLDMNIRYKEITLAHGHWSYYLSHRDEHDISAIFSWTLRAYKGPAVSEWKLIIDDWEKFLKGWESI